MMVMNKELKEQTEHNIQGLATVDVFNLRVATVGVYIYIYMRIRSHFGPSSIAKACGA